MEHDNMFTRTIKSKWLFFLALIAFAITTNAQTKRGLITMVEHLEKQLNKSNLKMQLVT